ncbi:MAG: RICIN domain-containing protein [Actinobacteria bacterium]|nr:RICIN domain-containing protein [Actinomycetota bacterium]
MTTSRRRRTVMRTGISCVLVLVLAGIVVLTGIFASPSDASESHDAPHEPGKSTASVFLPDGHTWVRDETLSDDFDGPFVDRAKWGGLWYPTSQHFAFDDSANITISGGALNLMAKKQKHNGKSYTGAALRSLFTVPGNSYMEVRAKMLDKRANVTSAIWTQGPLDEANVNPEIDLAESMIAPNGPKENGFLTNQYRWWLDRDNTRTKPMITDSSSGWNSGVDVTAGYHVYGLERIDNTLRFYFDGELYKQTDVSAHSVYVTVPRAVIFSIEGHAGDPVDAHLPSSFQVDYVHTYLAREPSVFSGVYALVNRRSDRVLTVPDAAVADDVQLIQNGDNSPDQRGQRWRLEEQQDGSYKIRNTDTHRVVSVAAGDTDAVTSVVQSTDEIAPSQRWRILPVDDGRVRIVNVASKKALATGPAGTTDGAGVIQWDDRFSIGHNDEWQIVR